jgi:hypothetical protein
MCCAVEMPEPTAFVSSNVEDCGWAVPFSRFSILGGGQNKIDRRWAASIVHQLKVELLLKSPGRTTISNILSSKDRKRMAA